VDLGEKRREKKKGREEGRRRRYLYLRGEMVPSRLGSTVTWASKRSNS
jgi:hypothetical protein